MNKFILLLISAFFAFSTWGQECADCNTLLCDGVNCDDGSSADGVQTSRNCSCGKAISGACAYAEFNLSANPYYDANDPSCSLLFTTQESGNFNIYFLDDATCEISDCSTPDFIVSSGAVFAIPQNPIVRVIVCKNGGNAGRRDFRFSISCSSIENCVNTIDDDLDNWTDCEDEDCNFDAYCTYTETTSSNDGGLESNGRLGEKIAKRNFLRVKSNAPAPNITNQKAFVAVPQAQLRNTEDFNIRNIIPDEPIDQVATFVSTPTDLIGVTNATDVFSVDMYDGESRVASILATASKDVYEHSKYICDRLHGARIEKVVKEKVNDVDLLITKFTRASGIVEYNASFSFFEDENESMQLHSHWNLSEYPTEHNYFNYQIWANNLHNLKTIARQLIQNLSDQVTIGGSNAGEVPNVLINTVSYHNKQLQLKLNNPDLIQNAMIKGLMKKTETSFESTFTDQTIHLAEILKLQTEGVYSLGVTLYGDNLTNADAVYFSDGAWGIDYTIGESFIHKFDIYNDDYFNTNDSIRLLERNVNLQAVANGGIAIYRPLNAAYISEDLSHFDEFVFEASGAKSLEVVFVLGKNQEWDQHPREIITLSEDFQRYNINLKSFAQNLDDLKMIVYKVNGKQDEAIDLAIENSHFRLAASDITEKPTDQWSVYPNPVKDRFTMNFKGTNVSEFEMVIRSMDGKAVTHAGYRLAPDSDEILIQLDDRLDKGMYVVQVNYGNNNQLSSKIFVQ